MSREEGLKNKYRVERRDGKPVGDCIVLELRDPNSHSAIREWADTVEADGYKALANDVREQLQFYTGRYWGRNYVYPCPDCGIAPFNVDDCGHFGDPCCPYFGVGINSER